MIDGHIDEPKGMSKLKEKIFQLELENERLKTIALFRNKILALFPTDKDYTTISKHTIKQIAKEMACDTE